MLTVWKIPTTLHQNRCPNCAICMQYTFPSQDETLQYTLSEYCYSCYFHSQQTFGNVMHAIVAKKCKSNSLASSITHALLFCKFLGILVCSSTQSDFENAKETHACTEPMHGQLPLHAQYRKGCLFILAVAPWLSTAFVHTLVSNASHTPIWLYYCMPPDAVKAELHNPRVLFVFGTYTIGKERIFLEVSTLCVSANTKGKRTSKKRKGC